MAGDYFMPESCLFCFIIFMLAGVSLAIIIGAGAAAGWAFGFIILWCLAAKAPEVETARMATVAITIFFMINSLGKEKQHYPAHRLELGQEHRAELVPFLSCHWVQQRDLGARIERSD